MFNLPVFVSLDYHQKVIQVCVMDSQRKILTNQSVANDPEAVFQLVAPFGTNIHVAIEASTGVADAAHRLIRYNPQWKAMADRLRGNGKKACVIVAAVANRWIRWLFRQMVEPTSVAESDVGFLRHGQESITAKNNKAVKNPSDVGTMGLAISEGSVHNVLP
jgi:hypothetical protein